MAGKFKRYGIDILLQIPVLVLMVIRLYDKVTVSRLLWLAGYVVLAIAFFLFKYRYQRPATTEIIRSQNDKLIINGIFGKKELKWNHIQNLTIRTNFI